MRAGILTEHRHVAGIDAELSRVTPHERDRGTHVIDRIRNPREPARAVVDGEPVVAGLGKKLEKLSREGNTTPGVPVASVNDHDGRASVAGLLNVGVQGERLTVDPPVHDLAAHTRDQVIAVRIPDDYWKTLPGRGAREPREEDPGGERARQDERPTRQPSDAEPRRRGRSEVSQWPLPTERMDTRPATRDHD